MGVASLVLGIIALVIAVIFPVWGYIAIALGVVGIILAAIGKKKGAKCATGGLVCSIIATALSLAFWLACAACASAVGGSLF